MIIYLDPKTYQYLGSYALKPGNIELELRFGHYENKRFKPDIGLDTYNKLDTYLRSNPQMINKIEREDSNVEIYENGVRKVIYQDGRFLYQKKNKLYTSDIEYKDFVLRLSESDEVSVKPSQESYVIKEIRERNRTLYYQIFKAFYYSLTKVTTKSPDNDIISVSYELEIEYTILPVTLKNLVRMVQDSVNYVLPILTGDNIRYSYVPLSEESYIKDQYSSLYIKEPKPVNLNRYVTPDLQSMGYSVTNKLDGERFILVFTNIGFYAFNNRRTEKYDGKVYGNTSGGFIYYALDTEFFEGKYYVFDCMIYNGQKIIENTHEERIRDANNIVRTLAIPNNFINVKNFYRGDLKTSTENLLKNLPKDKNDGLIYTSNGRYNSNIYKWKFPDKMSIDFAVYKIKDSTYELYVKDNIDDFPVNVPFHGSNMYEIENAFYDSKEELKNMGIYEFGYNNDTDKFILFRERPDKIDPNFITVAENVWNDIKNPYTSQELINLLSPKVLEKYRKYQNNIKRDLIEKYCQEKDVLDLGSGRGGDLGKYDSSYVNHLWCVEPNEKNYTELLRRLSERKTMKSKTTLIKTVAQDTEKIVSSIRNTLLYDVPIVFTSKVSLTGLLAEDKPNVKSFTVNNFNNLDHLKSIIQEVLLSEYNIDMDKNSFIVSNNSGDRGDMILDDYLFDTPLDYVNSMELFVRYPKYDKEEVQDLGGDYKNWFPKVFGVDYNSLRITDEGMYSLTKHIDSVAIIRAMKNIIGEENIGGLTIMDGTANVGGDTIRFGMYFKSVIGVELNDDNFDVLNHNVGVYRPRLNNISVIKGDILDESVYQQVHTDVLYLDPPWGGKGYKDYDEEKMVIFLSNVSLTQFIGNVLLNQVRPSYIFIKLPINYNIDSLRDMPYVNDMQVYKIRKFYLVCLLVDNKTTLKKADVLSSFFSLSFFFFRDEMGLYNDLDKLVDTIDSTIKNGGHFIGTTIDGKRTNDLLSTLPNKKFDFEGGYIKITDEDKGIVELLIKDTIVETQTESLVDFGLLERKLYDRGIFLKESEIFKDSVDLTERENILNSLYRTFVFYKETNLQKYRRKTLDILRKRQAEIESSDFKESLRVDDIFNTISLKYNSDTTSQDDSLKSIACIPYLDDLLQERGSIGYGDYSLLSFYYIPEITRILNKRFNNEVNAYKEYYNGADLNKSGTLNPNGIIQNIISYNVKKIKPINIGKLFEYNLKTILNCLYDIHNFSLLLRNRLVLSDPLMFIEKSNEEYNAKVLNYSYTKDVDSNVLPFLLRNSYSSYTFIEILQYMDISFKKNLYFSIDPSESEFNVFLRHFLNIESGYNNIKQNYHVQIIPDIMKGYNDDNRIESLENIFMIKSRLYDRYEAIDNLTENDYLYFEKIHKILNANKSTKIHKWLEVLNFSNLDRDGNYTVFSNGYMPHKFLIAMKSYLNVHYDNFEWWINTNVDIVDIPINKKCTNILDIETADVGNVTYINKKLNRSIDVYASYSSKNDIQRFLGDILFGLVTLKEGGLMLFNMTSYFKQLETSVIGLICDMFKVVKVIKPMNSGVTESEVYFMCNEYKRDEDKINLLKDALGNGRDSDYYIPDSINVSKYSDLLIAAYTNYGKQIYFMDKDMELYRKVKEMGLEISDITKNELIKSRDKFISYYVKRRIDMNKIVKETHDMFPIRKWNSHKCKKEKRKIKFKKENKEKKVIVDEYFSEDEGDKKDSFSEWQKLKKKKGEVLWGDVEEDIEDENYDEKEEEQVKEMVVNRYKGTERCIGKDVFKNIVSMTYELDLCDRIRNVTDNIVNVDLVSTLIRSKPRPTVVNRFFPNSYETEGLYLLESNGYFGREGSNISKISTNFLIYKPQSETNTYILELSLFLKVRVDEYIYNDIIRDVVILKFKYTKEPKPETLIKWIKDNVFTFIYNHKDNQYLNRDYFTHLINEVRENRNRRGNKRKLDFLMVNIAPQ